MDSCEGCETLVQHFKSVRFFRDRFQLIFQRFPKCFALCNINIWRISDFKEFLQFQTPWTHMFYGYLYVIEILLRMCSKLWHILWRPYYIKDILLIGRIQRRAMYTKYILNDYNSSYKSCLLHLNLLPLMYIFELNDLTFFIKSYKSASSHFNINDYINFRISITRSSTFHKMIHKCSSSTLSHYFYFCRLPRLWNFLPPIDLTLPITKIVVFLKTFLWSHFVDNFDSDNVCNFFIISQSAPAVIVPVVHGRPYLT